MKKVVQDLTSGGIDWQREKWQSGFGSKFIRQGEKNAVKYADEVIVLSKGVQKYFMDTYGRETHFIPNGVNRPQIRKANLITEKFELKKDSYILFLGRLVPEKGIRYLVEAFKNVRTDKKLVIAGGSSDTDSFMEEYKDCETLTDEMLYELVEKVVIHSASGGRTIYRQQQIDIYFNFIGDTFPSQIEISHGDKKNLTEQQLAKRKKYQKTSGKNRKKKRAALREAAKTDPQAAAEYEALLQKGRERCRKYAQNKKLAQQEPADTVPIQFEPSFETPEEMKGESA